LIIKDKTN